MTCRMGVELVRLKKVPQDPDAPLKTSISVEVSVMRARACPAVADAQIVLSVDGTAMAPIVEEDDAFATRLTRHLTRVVGESGDPFFNDGHEYGIANGVAPLVTIRLHAVDNNYEPPRSLGWAQTVVSTTDAKHAKYDRVLPLCDLAAFTVADEAGAEPQPAAEMGAATLRFTVKVVKAEAPAGADGGKAVVRNPDDDVELAAPPAFSGLYPLVAEERTYTWWYFLNDSGFRDRFKKTVEGHHPLAASGHAAGSGSRAVKTPASVGAAAVQPNLAKPQRRTATAAAPHGDRFNALLCDTWHCKQSHQVYAKMRCSAEKFLRGETPVTFTADEEDALKRRWKELGIVRAAGVVGGSAKVKMQLQRSWVLFLSGDQVPEGPTFSPSIEQRTKMSMASFDKASYEALRRAMLELVCPSIGDAVAAAIAKRDFEADQFMAAVAAERLALKQQQDAFAADAKAADDGKKEADKGKGSSSNASSKRGDKPSPTAASPTAPSPTAPAVKSPSAWAFEMFAHVMATFADFWCDTLTEVEYVQLLKDMAPALLAAKARCGAGDARKGRRGSERRRSSVGGVSPRRASSARRKSSVK
jgi:hypothetical protein